MKPETEKKLRELHRLNCHGGLMGVDSFISLIPQIQSILQSDNEFIDVKDMLFCDNCKGVSTIEHPVHHYECGHSYCTYCTKDGCLCDCKELQPLPQSPKGG